MARSRHKFNFTKIMAVLTAIVVIGTAIVFVIKRFFHLDIKAKVNGELTTVTDEKIKQIAEDQYNAMKGPGTREEPLFAGLEGLSAGDLKGVFNAFGKKSDFTMPWTLFAPKTLIDWYKSELSGDELERMRNIWKDTGLM